MTRTAKTYGGALYDLACSEDLCERIFQELQTVAAVFREQPEYRKLLMEPSISKAERCGLIDEAWKGSVHPYVCSFMKLLCENGTIGQLTDCAEAFKARYYEDQGILTVRAVCAAPLKPEQESKLTGKIAEMTGKKIELTVTVDEKLIGGIRLELPDRQYDGSVRHQLDVLRKVLSETAVEPRTE